MALSKWRWTPWRNRYAGAPGRESSCIEPPETVHWLRWYTWTLREGKIPMATIELTKDNFDQVVSGNEMVIIDFWAPWCGPCRGFAPVFEAASEKYPDIVFGKINSDDEQELAGQFGIRSIPTLMIFREQIGIFSQPGALPASTFDDVISKAKALDMAPVHKEIAERESADAKS
jgi:thioredoxin 1